MACPIAAQNLLHCATSDLAVERLAERLGEARQALGLGTQGVVVEIFANEESDSWTITVTTPNGSTCLMGTGQAFEKLAEAPPATGDDLSRTPATGSSRIFTK